MRFVSKAHNAILNEIRQFYVQQENQTSDHNILYSKFAFHYEKIDLINSTDPKVYAEQMANVIDELTIEISISGWNQFLADVSTMTDSQSKRFQIENGVKEIAQYLNVSASWYFFLIKLHDIPSEYKMQNNPPKNAAKAIIMKISSVDENELKNLNDIGFMQLFDETDKKIYTEIENMKVNQMKLNALKNVLQQTMTAELNVFCSSTESTVKGYNVKMSDVINGKCSAKIKHMKFFAMNKLYIDINVDETGNELQLSMIAPTWEIIGGRQIILDGANGKAHFNLTAQNGVGHSENGLNGLPGKAGGPAGSFFGIGKQFLPSTTSIMDGELDIHINGGIGGPGQNGGNGNSFEIFHLNKFIKCAR